MNAPCDLDSLFFFGWVPSPFFHVYELLNIWMSILTAVCLANKMSCYGCIFEVSVVK